MMHPVLTLLVASALHVGADAPTPADLAQIVGEIVLAVPLSPSTAVEAEDALTVRDLPFHYSDFTPAALPAVRTVVTYDWRSPVIFDLP